MAAPDLVKASEVPEPQVAHVDVDGLGSGVGASIQTRTMVEHGEVWMSCVRVSRGVADSRCSAHRISYAR